MGNYEKLTNECIQWIQDWFAVNGPESPAVIGISGGKDSTIVAKLCVWALGADRVIGVSIPDEGQDNSEAKKVADAIGIKLFTVPINKVCETLRKNVSNGFLFHDNSKHTFTGIQKAQQNLPPRIRMSVLYFVAQCVGGRVVGTSNLSENFIGYFTKWGDGVSDMEPIGNLTVTEVRGMGDYLNIPHELVWKTPDDGLPHSAPDEEKFGFTYAELDRFIRFTDLGDMEKVNKIIGMHNWSEFKRAALNLPTFTPSIEALQEAIGPYNSTATPITE